MPLGIVRVKLLRLAERRGWQEADFSRLSADQTLDMTAEGGLTRRSPFDCW
ncbi:hypothetical protein [Sinorhizobium fredii]